MAAPAPTAFYVVHDVEGIKGLHLAVNAIGEGMEQRLFGHSSDPAAEQQFSSEMFQLANAVRDCGLLPGLPTPDHAKAEDLYPSSRPSSPPSSSPEFDSTGCWGETCVVVTTGASCVLHMHPPPGRGLQPKEVLLPRRSICVLSEDARYPSGLGGIASGWGHAFSWARAGDEGPPPKWNPAGLSRRIEMRSSMLWAIVVLQRELRAVQRERDKLRQGAARAERERQAKELKARIERLQRRRNAVYEELEFTNAGMLELRRHVAARADEVLGSQREAARMPAADAPFWHELPADVAALYPGPPPPVPVVAAAGAEAVAAPAAAGAGAAEPAASEHSPASQVTLPLSMHCQQKVQAAAGGEDGEVEQAVRSLLPLPGTPAASAVRR